MTGVVTRPPSEPAHGVAPDDVAPEPAATSTSPTARTLWRAARGPVLVGSAVLLVMALLALLTAPAPQGALDPRSAGPAGTMALARLLEQEGVEVSLVRRVAQARDAADPGTTLLVAIPDLLDREQLASLAGAGADVVLVEPGPAATRSLAPAFDTAGRDPVQEREPACTLPAATAAGDADMGGQLYEPRADTPPRDDPGPTQQCYAVGGAASLVQVRDEGRSVTLLGTGDVLTNDALDQAGNAALSMNLLGARERLVWFLPDPAAALGGRNRSFAELVPGWVAPAFWQLAVAALLVALWRARRLGPVVTEPLPVVVRGAETAEGRAGLYRRVRARDRAAESLRAASRARLGTALGLPRDATSHTMVTTLAARTGRPEAELAALVYGSAPGDDAALVSLADALDQVEREVRGR